MRCTRPRWPLAPQCVGTARAHRTAGVPRSAPHTQRARVAVSRSSAPDLDASSRLRAAGVLAYCIHRLCNVLMAWDTVAALLSESPTNAA